MKRVRKILAGVAISALVFLVMPALPMADEMEDEAGEAAEDEKGWSIEVGYDYENIYLFRGVDVLDGKPTHTPWAIATFGNLSVYYYGYLSDLGSENDYSEADYGIDYTWAFADDLIYLTGGVVAYNYPRSDSGVNTAEVYAIVGVDVPAQPSIEIYWDYAEFDAGYALIGASHSFDLGLAEPMALSIDISGSVGFDRGYNNPDSNWDPNDILLGVDIPWTINDHWYAHALIQESIALSSLDDIDQGNETVYTVGVGLNW